MSRFQEYLNAQASARAARESISSTSDSLDIMPSGDNIQISSKFGDVRHTILFTYDEMLQIAAWCDENLREIKNK